MPKTKQTSWNLPQDPKYHDWSKALLQAQIGQDPQLDPYLVRNADYLINLDTIAIYEFQKEPLLGKYKSVILDAKQGIVLSKRSTCALFTAYGRQCLLGGIEFQRELASKLQLQSQCVIATGKVALFSMHAYTAGNNDWIALQQMRDFDLDGRLKIIFKSLKYNQVAYTFSFSNCSRYIGTKVCDGLYYNHVIFELGKRHLEELSGWQVKTAASNSMIDQQAFFMPRPTFEHLSLQQLSSDLLNKQHLRYGQQLAAYYELTFVIKDHQTIYGLSKRRDTFF